MDYSQRKPAFEVRGSAIHGFGVFAARSIGKGERIIEYQGERISVEEANLRYDDAGDNPHVVLFTVDDDTLIDGAVNSNEARFINHSCTPNAQAEMHRKRVYIVALRNIAKGEELTYDYQLDLAGRHDRKTKQKYACRCGSEGCRGTMLKVHRSGGRREGGGKRLKDIVFGL